MNPTITIRYVHYFITHSLLKNCQNDILDVLEDHRMRNEAMRPPIIPEEKYQSQVEDVDSVDESVRDEVEDDESSARARRYSKTPRDADPKSTTMKYYPPCWQAVLEIAKNNMRKYVAVVNAFPRRDQDLKDAMLILKNAITEYEKIEGNTLEHGFSFVFFFKTSQLLIISLGYSPDRDMSILV